MPIFETEHCSMYGKQLRYRTKLIRVAKVECSTLYILPVNVSVIQQKQRRNERVNTIRYFHSDILGLSGRGHFLGVEQTAILRHVYVHTAVRYFCLHHFVIHFMKLEKMHNIKWKVDKLIEFSYRRCD